MNYKKLYYTLCEHCKTVDVRERLKSRNSDDTRLNSDYIYTEKHHIIPRHAGGNDDNDNLVVMLPEEHYMAHLIRFYAYNDRNDFLSIRFMVNGFVNKPILKDRFNTKLKNKLVASFKHHTNEFRNRYNWHTEDGIKRITESRIGMINVKDKNTSEKIGTVSIDHPNVQSGQWIHLSSGMVSVICKETNTKKYITTAEHHKNKQLYKPNNGDARGDKNSRFSGYTDEDLVNIVIEFSQRLELDFLLSYNCVLSYLVNTKEYEKLPKSLSGFRFNGNGLSGLHAIAEQKSGLKINRYWSRKPESRNKILNKIKKLNLC